MSETQNNLEEEKEAVQATSAIISLDPPKLNSFNILTYSGSSQRFFTELLNKNIKYLSIQLGMIYGDFNYGHADMINADKCVTSTITSVDRKGSNINYKAVEVGLSNTLKYLKSKKITVDQIVVMVSAFDEMTNTERMDTSYQLELVIADVVAKVKYQDVPVCILVPSVETDEIFMPLSGEVEKDTKKDKKKKKKKGKK